MSPHSTEFWVKGRHFEAARTIDLADAVSEEEFVRGQVCGEKPRFSSPQGRTFKHRECFFGGSSYELRSERNEQLLDEVVSHERVV